MFLDKIKLENFLKKLTAYSSSDKVDNQYKKEVQIKNFKRYLENMYSIHPTLLLVGEAPGYQGCAITGVPFTSEFIINSHKTSCELEECTVLGTKKEPTSTIVWGILDEKEKEGKLSAKPLMWNIFPFHPIKDGNVKTNRRPSDNECTYGFDILNELLDLFPSIEKVYAAGGAAAERIKCHSKYKGMLRYPSNGGKQKFKEGIDKIYL